MDVLQYVIPHLRMDQRKISTASIDIQYHDLNLLTELHDFSRVIDALLGEMAPVDKPHQALYIQAYSRPHQCHDRTPANVSWPQFLCQSFSALLPCLPFFLTVQLLRENEVIAFAVHLHHFQQYLFSHHICPGALKQLLTRKLRCRFRVCSVSVGGTGDDAMNTPNLDKESFPAGLDYPRGQRLPAPVVFFDTRPLIVQLLLVAVVFAHVSPSRFSFSHIVSLLCGAGTKSKYAIMVML